MNFLYPSRLFLRLSTQSVPAWAEWLCETRLRFDSSTAANIPGPTLDGVAAFAALIRPFERAIYLAALALVNEPEEALEIAQETVVRAFKSAAKMCPLQQFKMWMIATAIEQARAFLRDKKRINIDEVFADDEVDECDFRRDPRSLRLELFRRMPLPKPFRDYLGRIGWSCSCETCCCLRPLKPQPSSASPNEPSACAWLERALDYAIS